MSWPEWKDGIPPYLPLGHGWQYPYLGQGSKRNHSLSIYTIEASSEDLALLMDIRKKDINNITIIMTCMMQELLD